MHSPFSYAQSSFISTLGEWSVSNYELVPTASIQPRYFNVTLTITFKGDVTEPWLTGETFGIRLVSGSQVNSRGVSIPADTTQEISTTITTILEASETQPLYAEIEHDSVADHTLAGDSELNELNIYEVL